MARHRLVEKFFIRSSVWSPKTFVSPSTTAPRNELICPSRAWIVDGEKIVRDHLYATSGSSGQNGIKTNASAFRHLSNGWNDDAVRQGFAECDNPAIQRVASVSNENWIEESAYRQKDRDNIEIEPDFSSTVRRNIKVSDHAR